MRHHRLVILTLLLCVGCAMPSYRHVPPECEGNHVVSTLAMNKLGRADEAACRAAIQRQGSPMSIMKSPGQLQQEFGGRRPQGLQQDMPPMTPEQYQQAQQLMQQIQPMMQQMSPMMQQMQGGMMPQGMPTTPRPAAQTPTSQPQMQQGTPSQMTPEQEEQLRQQMLQQLHQQPQAAPAQ